MRNKKSLILGISGGCTLLGVIVLAYFMLWAPNNFSPSPKIVPISRGISFSQIVEDLAKAGIVRYPLRIKIAGKIFGFENRIRVGKYSFQSGISNWQILRNITDGTSTANPSVTIYEGLRGKQVAKLLRREIGIDSLRFVSLLSDTSLIGMRGHRAGSLEGFLLPDTYVLYWQTDEKQIIEQMVSEFRKFFTDSLQKRTRRLGFSVCEVITVASIVESETKLDEERPIIAGLYYNRLRKRMRLEADPTVQYSLPNGPRRLRYSDLKIESPYNTYLHLGLPPGPINNPGRKSIIAALFPTKHQYLYFVASGNGGHLFAKSYSEHLKNVRAYRKVLKAQEFAR